MNQEHEKWDRPEHYGGEENPFEPIKIIEHYDLPFSLGNAVKYILRAGRKPADESGAELSDYSVGNFPNYYKLGRLKDLRKAYTYIGFEIRRLEREQKTK